MLYRWHKRELIVAQLGLQDLDNHGVVLRHVLALSGIRIEIVQLVGGTD